MERDENSLNFDVNFLLKDKDLLQIISHLSYINAFKGKPETKCNFDMAFLCLWKKLYDMFEYIIEYEPEAEISECDELSSNSKLESLSGIK